MGATLSPEHLMRYLQMALVMGFLPIGDNFERSHVYMANRHPFGHIRSESWKYAAGSKLNSKEKGRPERLSMASTLRSS